MDETITIGKPEIRKDARGKVSGAAEYVADISVPGLKVGVVLRSPHLHANILKIETSEARKMPGVLAVLTIEDVPGEKVVGDLVPDRPVLAQGKVRFKGEPVAVIVAETLEAANQARQAVKVTYEELPSILDPYQALQPGAPALHPDGNLLSHFEVEEGSQAAGFAEADVILEEDFFVPRVYPAYMETEASLAQWQEGGLTVWVSSQKPFHDRHLISQALGMDEELIHVRIPAIGGAFGGKEDSSLHILAALAALKIRGAVRFVNSREESILAHPKRHAARLHYKIGAKKDGTLTAIHAVTYMDTGAYASYGPAVGQLLTECAAGPYHIPNARADTYLVYTNGPIAGAMRGFGSPQVDFAYESLMDMLAHKLNMDPGELRRKNIWRPGDKSFTRVKVNQAEAAGKCLALAIRERERLKKIPAPANKRAGVGFAIGLQTMGLGFQVPDDSANQLEWMANGSVRLHIGAPDLGQGLETVAAQMAAEALGIPYDRVEVVPIDTSDTPDAGVTCASRMTYLVGNSVIIAAREAVEQLIEEASRRLGVSKDQLTYEHGMIQRPGKPGIPAAEITSRMAEEGERIAPTGVFSFPYGPETPAHLPMGMPHVKLAFGAHVVRVEVDPETGVVTPTEVVAIHDVGRIINRAGVEGQIEGGVSMGLGYALKEEVALKPDGNWVNGFSEYLLFTPADMPELKTIILEEPEETGPWGAKGIGEMSVVPTAAAVTNAIFDAVSVRLHTIPVNPEMVAAACQE